MSLASGTLLGPYEILAPLGAGGMGEVYRARDTRLGRSVALKILPDSVARDPDRLARLEREARAVAALSHPNIVVIHSIERDGDARFITMELVEGQSLEHSVVPRGLPIARLLDYTIQLAEALVVAHGKGVVHRDLKPANIIVTPEGRVKVLDFGLAKVVRSDAAAGGTLAPTMAAPLSMAGEVVGTVPYMAPEQLRGEPVDARTDLFSFGVILYELAAGARPFRGAADADVTSEILRDAPPPLTRVRADLPLELERVIARCLEKSPRDRFQSALEVRDALRRLQRTVDQTASAAAGSGPERPSIAVLPFSNMSADPENEYFSDGLSEELLNVLTKIPDLKVTGRTSSFAFKGKHEDMRVIGQKLGVSTLLEGSVRKAGNRVRITAQLVKVADGFHLWSETYDRVLDDIFAVQDDIARSVSTALHVTLLGKPATKSRSNAESYQLVLRGNQSVEQNNDAAVARAVTLYREAIDKCPDDARAWAGLAKAHLYQAFFGYADLNESHKNARTAVERALALDDGLADAHQAMGMMLASLEFRWKEGMAEILKATALAPNASGPMTALSVYKGAFGEVEEALAIARKAQEADPLDPNVYTNRGRIESWAGNLEMATEAYLKALELSPGMASVHSSLGLVYLRRGMGREAIAEIQKEKSSGYREYALAAAYHVVGMREESDAAMERLHRESEQWGYQFAVAHAIRGELDQAFHWLDRSYELHDSGIVMSGQSWVFENLHSDPRWPRFLERIGLEGRGKR